MVELAGMNGLNHDMSESPIASSSVVRALLCLVVWEAPLLVVLAIATAGIIV
jgi:hypothetical protein